MKILYDEEFINAEKIEKVLGNISNVFCKGDLIIINSKLYEIIVKIINIDTDEIYCKVKLKSENL